MQQPVINIGLLGHVANGKSSLVRSITGEKTARGDSRCMQKGESREMTIQIGYSNAKIYQCSECPKPDCYSSIEGSKKQIPVCDSCGKDETMKLVQYVSLVDCFDPETMIMMADGTTQQIQNICIDDEVMGDDGTARTVLNVQNGQKCLYRVKYVTQIKNKVEKHEFICTDGHLLVLRIDTPVSTPRKRSSTGKYYVEYYTEGDNNTVRLNSKIFDDRASAQDFYEELDKTPVIFESTVSNYLQFPGRLRTKSRMFRAPILEFNKDIDLSVNDATSEEIAWLIGLWLADGSKAASQITTNTTDIEIIDRIKSISSKAKWTFSCCEYKNRNANAIYIGNKGFKKDSFTSLLRTLDILNNKHIPQCLKFSPVSIRRSLLSGIIDGDGYYGKGEFEIVQKEDHFGLALDINWICRSIGFSSRIAYKYATLKGQKFKQYRVQFNGDLADMTIVLPRKQGTTLVRNWATSQPFKLEKLGIGEYVGIETSGNNRFLLSDFVVVHNCPGHRKLMRNMISGSAVMDCAILVVDANKDVPQVQTLEHLTAAEIIGINHYVAISQNKVDLMFNKPECKGKLMKNYQQIEEFVKDTGADLSRTPVVPTCVSPARHINQKLILQHLVERAVPKPNPVYEKYPMFVHCVRSFDVNKPCPAVGLKGGVIGGTIMHGVLKIGDTLEIRPGYKTMDGKFQPLLTKVISLYTGNTLLQEARPGGLIGIGTTLDPSLTRSDNMIGMCAGYPDQLPEITTNLELKLHLLAQGIGHEQEQEKKIGKLRVGDVLQLAIGSATVTSKLLKRLGRGAYRFETATPVCPVPGQSIPVSKVIDSSWTIIGKAHLVGSSDINTPVQVTTPVQAYEEILDQTLTGDNKTELDTQTIPVPHVSKDGGARLVWFNFNETCTVLNRDNVGIQDFFHEELGTRITLNGKSQMVIHGKNRYQARHIQSILVKYIKTHVSCPTCSSIKTVLTKEPGSKHTQLLCKACGAEHLK